MKIHGLQKMTLLDYPGKVAATVFLGGCDLRCPFCHNAELLDASAPALMEDSELLDFLATRRGFLDGVCLTGGEPLLRPDLEVLIRNIRALSFAVKLDTNGTHPDRLEELLKQNRIDYVAMDIKNSPDRYDETCGRPVDLDAIGRSIRVIQDLAPEYEFRTTVMQRFHDAASFEAIAAWVSGAKAYYLQPYRVSEYVPDKTLGTPTPEELEAYRVILEQTVARVGIRG